MLQYRLKYEMVRTQMPNQNINFLFNLFSLLSIFNSTFSLSSHWFVSLQPCSLSFFFRSPSLILKSTVRRPHRSSHRSSIKLPPSPIKPPPSLLIWRLHHRRSENAIVTSLKPPLPPQSEVAMSPRSEPISATAWSCSTARLMRISATMRSRS